MSPIRKREVQPRVNNECIDCGRTTTAEGIACRQCWGLVEETIKKAYGDARMMVAKDIYAKKRMK